MRLVGIWQRAGISSNLIGQVSYFGMVWNTVQACFKLMAEAGILTWRQVDSEYWFLLGLSAKKGQHGRPTVNHKTQHKFTTAEDEARPTWKYFNREGERESVLTHWINQSTLAPIPKARVDDFFEKWGVSLTIEDSVWLKNLPKAAINFKGTLNRLSLNRSDGSKQSTWIIKLIKVKAKLQSLYAIRGVLAGWISSAGECAKGHTMCWRNGYNAVAPSV